MIDQAIPSNTSAGTLPSGSMPQNAPNCPLGENANASPPSALTPAQLAAIDLFLSGASDTSISQTLSIDRKTLYRWKTHNPSFRSELLRRRDDLYRDQAHRLSRLLSHALDTLERQVADPYNPTSHRAAATILRISRLAHLLHPKSTPATDNEQRTTACPELCRMDNGPSDLP